MHTKKIYLNKSVQKHQETGNIKQKKEPSPDL